MSVGGPHRPVAIGLAWLFLAETPALLALAGGVLCLPVLLSPAAAVTQSVAAKSRSCRWMPPYTSTDGNRRFGTLVTTL
jgi:hypothetical protein